MDTEVTKAFLEKSSPTFYIDIYNNTMTAGINLGLILFMQKKISNKFVIELYGYDGELFTTYEYPTKDNMDNAFNFMCSFKG